MKLRTIVDYLYIYGTGLYGQSMYQTLSRYKIKVDGFVISNCKEDNIVCNLPVIGVHNIKSNNVGIVLGLNKFNTIEVLDLLKNQKFDMNKVVYRREFVRNICNDFEFNENPMIEITTKIGCNVNCLYCPQKLLLEEYFKIDVKRKSIMELDDFIECLNKLPLNCDIVFCGMSEPLLNPQCIEMMQIACGTGRTVELFTTLEGAHISDVEKICNLPLNLVTLHIADKFGNANISISEEYYAMVEKLINVKKIDGTSLVNYCSSQGEADPRIQDICEGKCEIITILHDRAGNLQGENLMKQNRLHGKISCSFCRTKLNRNILLPDGTMLLCCMDYGMKHSLGNLLNETYDEIMNGEEMRRIKKGVEGDETIDILCRNCSQAHEIE